LGYGLGGQGAGVLPLMAIKLRLSPRYFAAFNPPMPQPCLHWSVGILGGPEMGCQKNVDTL